MDAGCGFPALEFEGGVRTANGISEAQDAAGVDCRVPPEDDEDPPEAG